MGLLSETPCSIFSDLTHWSIVVRKGPEWVNHGFWLRAASVQPKLSTLISINKLERFVGWQNAKRIGNPKPTYASYGAQTMKTPTKGRKRGSKHVHLNMKTVQFTIVYIMRDAFACFCQKEVGWELHFRSVKIADRATHSSDGCEKSLSMKALFLPVRPHVGEKGFIKVEMSARDTVNYHYREERTMVLFWTC